MSQKGVRAKLTHCAYLNVMPRKASVLRGFLYKVCENVTNLVRVAQKGFPFL
jgi:hypothetical protein